MADKVTVWDGDGNKCVVDPIDAKEIVEQGGRMSDPAGVKHNPNPVALPDDIYIPDAGFDADGKAVPTVTYTEADAIAQNDGVDVSVKAKKAKK